MNGFRVLVVDDEPLARGMVATLIRRDPDVELVVECGNPGEVAALIAQHQPHIAFFDIEMPGMDGLQLASVIGDEGPVVVFITAFSQYATRAFDVNAIDYVMKPFSDQRLLEALDRAKRRVRERRLGELASQAASIAGTREQAVSSSPTYPARLAFKTGDRAVVLKPEEIVWIEAEDYYALVHSTRGRHLVRIPMASLEQQLDPQHFIRAHRGAIVNLREVKVLDHTDGAWLLMSDGSRVPVSRSRRRKVEERLLPP
ncbi:MAG: response regulator transcription factor [Acidobacteria bacterium]|nr:response regulator transcription factor [Acidobacteriota bacterium]